MFSKILEQRPQIFFKREALHFLVCQGRQGINLSYENKLYLHRNAQAAQVYISRNHLINHSSFKQGDESSSNGEITQTAHTTEKR